MELKQLTADTIQNKIRVLIVPSGIETTSFRNPYFSYRVLIVPSGIETTQPDSY